MTAEIVSNPATDDDDEDPVALLENLRVALFKAPGLRDRQQTQIRRKSK